MADLKESDVVKKIAATPITVWITVIISIFTVLLTVATLYAKDRLVAQQDIIVISEKQTSLTEDVRRVERLQREFLTKDEAQAEFRALEKRLDGIQSDIREVLKLSVNKR